MKKGVSKTIFYILVIALVLVWISPLLFIVLSSIKSKSDFFNQPIFYIPEKPHWENFLDAWEKGDMAKYILNGAKVSLIKVPIGVFLEALTAFALCRLGLKKQNTIFIIFLIGMMIPNQVTLVPLNMGMTRLGLVNAHLGLILVYCGFRLPFGILVMRGFLRSVPDEIDESARLDGCGNFRLFCSILCPIAKPALATLVILDFLDSWNEYLFSSLLITTDALRTVPSGLMSFFGEHGTDYPLFTAGVLISVIPIMLVYLFCQRYFVEGMAGAVKG